MVCVLGHSWQDQGWTPDLIWVSSGNLKLWLCEWIVSVYSWTWSHLGGVLESDTSEQLTFWLWLWHVWERECFSRVREEAMKDRSGSERGRGGSLCIHKETKKLFEALPCFLKVLRLLLLVSGKPQTHVQPLGLSEVTNMGFPSGASGKESACQCRRCKRCRFNPWLAKIPCRKKWQPTRFLAWKIPWTEEPVGL